ncbi:hypothetical protein GOP47_0030483 [Adiantum capillus-veneris]|nr:hypothetical protein GOP47_0030483 [Adiantum capillus-veneris]
MWTSISFGKICGLLSVLQAPLVSSPHLLYGALRLQRLLQLILVVLHAGPLSRRPPRIYLSSLSGSPNASTLLSLRCFCFSCRCCSQPKTLPPLCNSQPVLSSLAPITCPIAPFDARRSPLGRPCQKLLLVFFFTN